MAQLSVHDAVLGEDKLNVKNLCETIAKLLSAVDKADKKACLAAAEGALGALSKLSGVPRKRAVATSQNFRLNAWVDLNNRRLELKLVVANHRRPLGHKGLILRRQLNFYPDVRA